MRLPEVGCCYYGVGGALPHTLVQGAQSVLSCRTCFWGGNVFAPKLKITAPDGTSKSVQQFLQDTFLDMYAVVVQTLGGVEGVLGFEVSTSFSSPERTFTIM